jgi:hypothetical protein
VDCTVAPRQPIKAEALAAPKTYSLQEPSRMNWMIFLILLIAWSRSLAKTNPHQPYKQIWILTDGETHTTLSETTHTAPLGTWWLELQFCFRDINPAYGATPPDDARRYGFYACPGHQKSKDCGGIQYSFCKSWACVTSNDGEWKWVVSKPDLLKFAFVNGVPWGSRCGGACAFRISPASAGPQI